MFYVKMSDKENIDRQIYRLSPNIRRHVLPLYGGYICSALGLPAALVWFSADLSRHQTLSELIAVLMVFGGISLLVVVCYYLFGDCVRPYYRPSHSPIEREEGFYDRSQRETIEKAVNEGDTDALSRLPRSIQAQIVVVSYRDADNRITAMQAFENDEDRLTPLTGIFFNEKEN